MIIREVENPSLKDFFKFFNTRKDKKGTVAENILRDIILLGSGKGAIALILEYLSKKRIIVNKLDEVIVADWIGYWVYNQIQPYAFPVKRFSKRTKAILVYHQYGFPQNMDKILDYAYDKNLIVIEDCAHAIKSYYKNRLLGSFGDFALFSFSKWFFCFALGGVKSKHKDFYDFVDICIQTNPVGICTIKDLIKYIYEKSSFSKINIFKKYANLFLNMSYSFYGEALKPNILAIKLVLAKIEDEINTRIQRYKYFYDRTINLGICNHLEREGITPYVIPIRCKDDKRDTLLKALRNKGLITEIYNFDINRNQLSPRFEQCIWIPCHKKISDILFEVITETVIKSLK